MIQLRNNYSYKFTNAKHVYCIVQDRNVRSPHYSLYSVPHTTIHTTSNVLIGFVDPKFCDNISRMLQEKQCSKDIAPARIELDEFKYIGNMMNLPVVVIINKHEGALPEQFELYYHFKKTIASL